jgi:hypothetical protein
VKPTRLVEGALGRPKQIRQGENDGARDNRWPQGGRLDRDLVERRLPQIPHDAVATKWRLATTDASNGRTGGRRAIVRLVISV